MMGNNSEHDNVKKIRTENKQNFFSRFMSKKYKCVIIWLVSMISMSEMIYLLLQKSDDLPIKAVLLKYLNVTGEY